MSNGIRLVRSSLACFVLVRSRRVRRGGLLPDSGYPLLSGWAGEPFAGSASYVYIVRRRRRLVKRLAQILEWDSGLGDLVGRVKRSLAGWILDLDGESMTGENCRDVYEELREHEEVVRGGLSQVNNNLLLLIHKVRFLWVE